MTDDSLDDVQQPKPRMTREQVVASCERARLRTQEPGFGVTPIQPHHVARFEELKRLAKERS